MRDIRGFAIRLNAFSYYGEVFILEKDRGGNKYEDSCDIKNLISKQNV